MRIKLTDTTVAAIKLPADKPQLVVWDDRDTGFGVVVGARSRTFIAERRVDGKKVRTKIGILGSVLGRDDGAHWTATLARIEARKILGDMSRGIDPHAKERSRADGPTLQAALDFHIGKMQRGENRRGKVCSPRSIATLKGAVELHLADYLDRPLLDLTADAIDEVRTRIERDTARKGGSNPDNPAGRASSNRILAAVSAIWRSWHKRHGLPIVCPVERLTPGALAPRDNRIANDELPAWYAKVMAMTNEVRRDLQLVALFTGVRTDGVRSLRWDDVDTDDELIQIERAKGDRPYAIPLTPTLREILDRRRKGNAVVMGPQGGDHGFVFPSLALDGKTVQPVAEVKERRVVRDAKGRATRDEDGALIREQYLPGVQACRKTYNSVAIEIGVPREVRERLMNHEGRGVNVKSYGFPHDWQLAREWADKVEAGLWSRIRGENKRGRRGKLHSVARSA